MSALTTNTTLFNSNGVYDPEIFKTGVAIKRKIDFSLAEADASTNYEFLPLPKDFVLKGVVVKELEKCGAATTITLKTKSDSATLGAAVSIGTSTLANTYMKPLATGSSTSGYESIYADGDMLCFAVGDELTSGKVEISVIGDLYDGDTLNGYALTVPYRSAGQEDGQNASKGDIYLKR